MTGEAMFNLHRVRLLREVSLRGSLAAAAAALGYDPSTVSQQLKVLEREVGTRLLEPVGRRVRLTAAASVLVEHGETMLQEMERAEAKIAAMAASVIGTVRLATFQSAAHAFVIDALTSLGREHPLLEVEVSEFDVQHALPALVAREHDIVLQEAYPGNTAPLLSGVGLEVLGEDELLLVDAERRPFEALADAPWVMEPVGTLARSWSESLCRSAGFEPRVMFSTSDMALQVRIAGVGLAVALVPRLAVPPERLHLTEAVPGGTHRTLATAVRSGAESSPAIAAVRAALREAFAAHGTAADHRGTEGRGATAK